MSEQHYIQLGGKQAKGYVIPLGPVNLVFAITEAGMVACGAFDVMALDKFNVAAARVKGAQGPVATLDDLLAAAVKDANAAATARGVKPGMTGKEALDLL